MTEVLILLILLSHLPQFIATKIPVIHHCQIEPYAEILNLENCLNTSISINTTRCRGQCYSEDFLIYDWKYFPTYYRHQRYLHCCLPNNTKSYETQILCQNKQLKILQYQIITQCRCKLCSDKCFE